MNSTLSVLRFVLVFFVLLFLLEPFVKKVTNSNELPTINVLIDNSTSVATVDSSALKNVLKQIKLGSKELEGQYEFQFYDLKGILDTLVINEPSTNLYQSFKNIDESNIGFNVAASVLVSDGIVNQGLSLENIRSQTNVFAIGLGDTTAKNDIQVKEMFVNRSAFLGNQFPVQASILAKGYKGKTTTVRLLVNGKEVEKSVVVFSQENDLKEVAFKYTSKKPGLLNVAIKVDGLEGEISSSNNLKSKFVKVNESRLKLCFLTRNPHPDIKAITSAINSLDKYEVDVFHLSFKKKLPKLEDYDLFILHQLPGINSQNTSIMREIFISDKPRWIIIGNNTDLRQLNTFSKSVNILNNRSYDEVSGDWNTSFDLFSTEELDLSFAAYSSPLKVPYAKYIVKPESEVVLFQKVGTTLTDRPLLLYNNSNNTKELCLTAEGIWRWRITEFLETGATENFDEMISKLIGLLDPARKNQQFEATIVSDVYNISSDPKFVFVSKNQLGELVYDNEITLNIFKGKKKVVSHSFFVSENNNYHTIPPLDTGIYRFEAITQLGGKKFTDYGSFSVEDVQLEDKDLVARFDGLRALATNNGGEFYEAQEVEQLLQELKDREYPVLIQSTKSENYLLDNYLPLLLLLLLVSIEWVARKVYGDV